MKKDATKNTLFSSDPPNQIAEALRHLAHSVTSSAAPAHDAAGGYVASLTEAVMGMTAGLVQIADALGGIRDMMSERNDMDRGAYRMTQPNGRFPKGVEQ